MSSPPVVLAVAGTDSGGAAGLAADLATLGHLGCHAACVVTAVTAQDTTGVHAVHQVPPDVVAAQVDAVTGDLPVAAVKTGMLGSADVVDVVADRLGHLPLVVDPVLVATSGAPLADEAVRTAYLDLLPLAAVATPNRDEALALLGLAADDPTPPDLLAAKLAVLGCAVVVTGGPEPESGRHEGRLPGRPLPMTSCTDWLCLPGEDPEPLTHAAVPTTADHGTGCTFSSALAAALAQTRGHKYAAAAGRTREPAPPGALRSACLRAADYVTTQLTTSSTWALGRGRGPIAHTTPTIRPGGSA